MPLTAAASQLSHAWRCQTCANQQKCQANCNDDTLKAETCTVSFFGQLGPQDCCCGLLVWWSMGLRSFWHNQPYWCHNGPLDPCCGLFVWWPLGHSQLLGQFGPLDCCSALIVWWPVGLRSSCHSQHCLCQKSPSEPCCGQFEWWPIWHSQLYCSNRSIILLRIICGMTHGT